MSLINWLWGTKTEEDKAAENVIKIEKGHLQTAKEKILLFNCSKSDNNYSLLSQELERIRIYFINMDKSRIKNRQIIDEVSKIILDAENILQDLNQRASNYEAEEAMNSIDKYIISFRDMIENQTFNVAELKEIENKLKDFEIALENVKDKAGTKVITLYHKAKENINSMIKLINEKKTKLELENFKAKEEINAVEKEIMSIRNRIENYSSTLADLNEFDRKLKNLEITLDDVNGKEKPGVKEYYVTAIQNIGNILTTINEKKKQIESKRADDNDLDDSCCSTDTGDDVMKYFEKTLNEEFSNAINHYDNEFKRIMVGSVIDINKAHQETKQFCEAQYFKFTSKILHLARNKINNFNHNANTKYEEFILPLARKRLSEIQQKTVEDFSKEKEKILNYIKDTNGQEDFPDMFQANLDEALSAVNQYKAVNTDDGCNKIIAEVQEFVDSVMKEVQMEKSKAFVNSFLEAYQSELDTKKFGKVYNAKLAEELENMKIETLKTFTDIKKRTANDDISCDKFSKELDALNNKVLLGNHKLLMKENKKYEKNLTRSQNYYTHQLSKEIHTLVYLPSDEEIDKIHNKVLEEACKKLTNDCKNLNIITNDIKFGLEQFANQEVIRKKEIISIKRFKQRKTVLSERAQDAYAAGIDLGTTFSCVTVFRNGKFEEIKNHTGLRTIPSVVYTGSSELSVGDEALAKGKNDLCNLIYGVKRVIGRKYNDPEVQQFIKSSLCTVIETDDGGIEICSSNDDSRFKPEDVSAEILKTLKQFAGLHLKHEVVDAVVTIPAFFTEPQRRATLEACKKAGLNVLSLLNEPTAAALAYAHSFKSEGSKHILVFDFGGGTCDISILEINGKNFEAKAIYGDNYLGGLDFDQNLMKYLVVGSESKHQIELNDHQKRRILKECEKAKKKLTEETTTKIYLAEIVKGVELNEEVTRAQFEDINKALFDRALTIVEKCLESGGLTKDEINDVVLAGGSSHIPRMQEKLREYFGPKKIKCTINPDEAISYGAALRAAILTKECKDDFKLTEITPFSLGKSLINDQYLIVIKKNSKIPCKGTERTETAHDYQSSVESVIYQGESSVASKNTFLGRYRLIDITKRKAGGTKFDTTFEIDENGILTVTSVEVGNEKTHVTVVVDRNVTY